MNCSMQRAGRERPVDAATPLAHPLKKHACDPISLSADVHSQFTAHEPIQAVRERAKHRR